MRAGDVIPQVVSPVTQRRTGKERPYVPPAKCPECGTPTVKPEGEVWTRCPNRKDCPGQIVQALKHFVSRGAMDIEGYGEKLVYRFYNEGLVRALPDLYGLTVEQLEQLEGFQRRSAENLVASIERSKDQPFHRVLYALGIPGIGAVNARQLAAHFGSMDRLLAASKEELEEVEGMGPILAGIVHETLAEERNRQLIEDLRGAGLNMEEEGGGRAGDGDRPLDGKTFVLTGTLEGMTPRRGDRAHHRARRQGDRLGVGQDGLRRRRRGPGLQAGQGAGARPARDRRASSEEATQRLGRPSGGGVARNSAAGFPQRPLPLRASR